MSERPDTLEDRRSWTFDGELRSTEFVEFDLAQLSERYRRQLRLMRWDLGRLTRIQEAMRDAWSYGQDSPHPEWTASTIRERIAEVSEEISACQNAIELGIPDLLASLRENRQPARYEGRDANPVGYMQLAAQRREVVMRVLTDASEPLSFVDLAQRAQLSISITKGIIYRMQAARLVELAGFVDEKRAGSRRGKYQLKKAKVTA